MDNNMNVVSSAIQDDIFFINTIEENDIKEDLLCNSLGCA